jgi:hypothetical protein
MSRRTLASHYFAVTGVSFGLEAADYAFGR